MLMSNTARPARLHYLPGSFRVLTPGDHVICGVSGATIPLEDLRYWSAALQQPFATAEIATQAMRTT